MRCFATLLSGGEGLSASQTSLAMCCCTGCAIVHRKISCTHIGIGVFNDKY